MYSQNRYEKSSIINDITCMMQNELHNEDIKIQMIDPLITHVILRLQPWIATLMIIFGLYFSRTQLDSFEMILHETK